MFGCHIQWSTGTWSSSNRGGHKAIGKEELHWQWQAIQHDSLLLDTVHDSWLDWSFGGHQTGKPAFISW